ncbi:MAG TPA: signal recognition particle-docking protein FtsY [Candidatus Levilactobacillus faecigallinarum]|uniref:Signal recognition particle receptor FtsY n=1 Tax=Candidatus Levilactobacillus faecigallinarum TaxID=2838638 RepID=A0A9D1QSU7_9LACO|nr:signal recognition particle-docking protein FtsY [Candidatus Levilactobacillus faecigallinarum]
MGLFDIFRRRAKKPTSEPTDATSESTASTTSGAASQIDQSATSASTSTSTASAASDLTSVTSQVEPPTPEVSLTNEPTEGSTSTVTVEASATAAPAPADEPTSTVDAVSEASVSDQVAASQAASVSVDTSASVRVSVASAASASDEAASTMTVGDESGASTSEAPEAPEAPEASETSAPTEPTEPEETDEQLYDKGLEKTRHTFGERLNALLANFRHVDEGFFDDLEETLIGADVGFDMAVKLSDELRDEVKLQNAKSSKDVQNVIVEKMVEIYDQAGSNEESTALNVAPEGPTVILFVGVNGVGKTTTIGKMANRYHKAGKKVLLAAADTFRAGATEQLNVWAERGDVDIVKGQPQSDPAAVVFDAVQKAKNENYDILFVDTAGRLQNKVNLMNELAKMKRIITREIPTAPHEVLLVLDATTGQNALTQAKLFKESTDVTGIVLTKLDGTARGGIVLAIRNELHVPVKFIGLGEQINDLRPFDPNEFVYGLFKGLIDVSALDKK